MPPYHAWYSKVQREWYLWDGHNVIRDEAGEIRYFVTAQAAYEWYASASRQDAWIYLSTARDAGDIGGYEELPGGKWLIQVPATRYAAYHGEQWGEIALSTREVLAFAEGRWAAMRTADGGRIHPVHRAGAATGSAIRDYEARSD